MKRIFFLFSVVFLILLAACSSAQQQNRGVAVTVYKSMSCGCCEYFSQYMRQQGFTVNVVNQDDVEQIKKEYNIPSSLWSCHTTIVDKYFVEGHVPVAAVDKLLAEKPDITGIGMAGMPSGSPGMPGKKTGDFVVYGVNRDGSTFEFVRI